MATSAAKILRFAGSNLGRIRSKSDIGSRLSRLSISTPSACRCKFTTSAIESKDCISSRQSFSTSQSIQHVDTESESDTIEKVNDVITAPDHGRLFAVIHFNSLQRKVTTDDIIVIQKHIEADVGQVIRFNKVMLVGGKDFSLLGRPVLSPSQVKVEARVIEKTLDHTKIIFNYHRRQNYRKFQLYKNPLTMVRIINIEVAPVIQ